MQNSVIRIGIVDDHKVVVTGLRTLLTNESDFYVAGCAATCAGAIELASTGELDVLILDIHLGRSSAIDVLTQLTQAAPETNVVIFSGFPEEQYAKLLFCLGARAFVDKAGPLENVVAAVRAVSQGATWFSTMLVNEGDSTLHDEFHKSLGFSKAEFQVFLKLSSGLSGKRIARDLNLSPGSISYHRTRLLRKLGLKNNQQLTVYALTKGYLQ